MLYYDAPDAMPGLPCGLFIVSHGGVGEIGFIEGDLYSQVSSDDNWVGMRSHLTRVKYFEREDIDRAVKAGQELAVACMRIYNSISRLRIMAGDKLDNLVLPLSDMSPINSFYSDPFVMQCEFALAMSLGDSTLEEAEAYADAMEAVAKASSY